MPPRTGKGRRVTGITGPIRRGQNIDNAEALRSRVKVIYGIPGLKVHCKLALVKRREGSQLKGYVHVGTGNFNEDTAKIYSDFSLFTANRTVAEDAERVSSSSYKIITNNSIRTCYWSPLQHAGTFRILGRQRNQNAKDGKRLTFT